MNLITDPNASATVPALPTFPAGSVVGYAQEYNAVAGTPATGIRSYHYNVIMQELMNVLGAAGVTAADGNVTQLLAALNVLRHNVTVLVSNGSFVVPSYVTRVTVMVSGAGGGGGASSTCGAGQVSVAPGGNAAPWALGVVTVLPNATIPVQVGGGGSGGVVSGGSGGDGGASSFGAYLSAPGGRGGPGVPAGTPPLTQSGNIAVRVPTGGGFEVGAEVAGWAGTAGGAGNYISGAGGSSRFGGGGYGVQNAAGVAGLATGAGGSGGSSGPSSPAQPGGNGNNGLVWVTW